MTTPTTPQVWVCLGDSLTHEPAGSPTTVLSPWPGRIDLQIFPARGAANHGHTGTRLATDNVNGVSMLSRFNSDIDGKGYYGMVLWGGINDVLADATGASVYADYVNIANKALAQGMKVIAIITHSASGYTGGWSAGRQAAIDSFRASVLALVGTDANLKVVNFYQAAPVGLCDPAAPTALYGPYQGVASDGLHFNQLAQDQVILPALIQLMQAAAAPAPVGLALFGVTASSVRRHHFPNFNAFSTASNPTAATVDEAVQDAAADLAGRLRLKNVNPVDINAQANSEAFKWCATTVRLDTAIRVYEAVTSQPPPKSWTDRLAERQQQLDDYGAAALGDGAVAETDTEPEGPTSHIEQHRLSIADPSLMSTAEPPFRKDDEL